MARQCKIDISPHRTEYEDLRLNKKMTYRDIKQIAKNKYNEELSMSCIARHFRDHVESYIDERIKSSKLRERYVKERLKEHINASINIVKTINMLNEQLLQVEKDMSDPKARKEMRDIARTLDSVLQTALRYKNEIKPVEEEQETDVYDRLLWALQEAHIPVEYIKQIKDKWDEYDKKGTE